LERFNVALAPRNAWPQEEPPVPRTHIVSAFVFAAAAVVATSSLAQAPLGKMKDCLLIEDMTKERLDCYDAVIAPTPQPSHKKAKALAECRFFKEEDERLICYNGFVSPAKPAPKSKKPALPKMSPPPK
jgi:hypothetical protein